MARQVVYDYGGTGTGTLSTINGILKDDYVLQNIVENVNKSTEFLERIRSEKSTHGRRFVYSIQTGVSQGTGSRDENEQLPDEGAAEYEQPMGNVKYNYSHLYITGQAIDATEGNKAAFASALKRQLKDTRDSLKLDYQRQMFGDGSGVIGKVDGVHTAQTEIAVKDPYGLTYTLADLDGGQKTRLFKRNMMVYFGTAGAARKVTAIDVSAGTITVDSAITLADGETIVRGDAVGRTSAGKEVEGLSKIIASTGTYHSVNRAGIPEFQGNEVAIGGDGSLNEDAMHAVLDLSEQYGTGEPDLLLCDHKTRRRYIALLESQKRMVNVTTLKSGQRAVDFAGRQLVVDKDCPPQRIYFLKTSDIMWMVMRDVSWIDRDGTVLKWVDGKDAYRAILRAYKNLACPSPNNQSVLTGIVG